VKNLVVRYRRLTGRRILIPFKKFPRQRTVIGALRVRLFRCLKLPLLILRQRLAQ
jgi:hypothetical protein